MNKSFDVIVIGIGSMGSSACYYSAQRGVSVLGLEQFDITHELGSHAGQSRIIRKAYFEHPDYVPLLNRAYENWKCLEDETGTQIYYRTGLVYFGDPEHAMMKGVKVSASLYNIDVENPDAVSVANSFPQFKIPAQFETLFEPDAGFVTPEKAIQAYTRQATRHGAEIHTKEKVLEWKKESSCVVVITNKNTYQCNKLIITAGAWSGKMIPGLADKIKVTRQFVAWIKPKNPGDFTLNNFSCWMIADDAKPGCYYGFPVLPTEKFGESTGLKLAHHYPAAITDPDNVNRKVTEEDVEDLKYALNKYMPGTFESVLSSKICLYANTPDENFIIDKLPGYEDHVTVACGFSGHGFKFVSVVGEILAELATTGKTKQPIGFLNAKRFV
ncbi:MAG: N-methyl-L-tryptophan oxidase [Chitinophagaceae bacterium]|nr:MAG: N-methyl-L-tryptophan oxidase [Chitinophagaceae bacterium]